MKLSTIGIDLLKHFEGCETLAYQDSVGVWTIGYGHTKGVYEGMTVSQEGAEELLAHELEEYEGYINDIPKVALTQCQFDGLVCWVYNLGPTNLRSSTLLKVLNEENYEDVPFQMRRWDKAGGVVLKGLTRRRVAESMLFEGKDWTTYLEETT